MKSLSISKILLSTVVAALCGCSSGDDEELVVSGECEATGVASKLGGISESLDINESIDINDMETRSIFFGGSNGNRFFQVWDTYDEPMVYNGSTFLGTFKPKENGVSTTTLSGNLTGSFKVGDKLTLYSPSPVCDFRGQDGTIAGMSSLYSFMTASATVASISGSTVTTSSMIFSSFAIFMTFIFRDENNRLLHVKKFTITTDKGTLAETMDLISGKNTTTSEYVITTSKETNSDDYPTAVYVVLYDLGNTNSTYTFTVVASDGKTYQLKNALSYLFNVGGRHYYLRYRLTCIDVEAGVSTGITPPTDEDVQIDDVVKE
jgi:hypothetical protein